VHLENLRDGGQVRCHRVVSRPVGAGLPDLQRGKGRHRVAHGGSVQFRPPTPDHPVTAEPLEPGLNGAARDAEAAGALQDPDARLGREDREDAPVELVEQVGGRRGHGVHSAGRFGTSAVQDV
jgi:hypothetical protein